MRLLAIIACALAIASIAHGARIPNNELCNAWGNGFNQYAAAHGYALRIVGYKMRRADGLIECAFAYLNLATHTQTCALGAFHDGKALAGDWPMVSCRNPFPARVKPVSPLAA